MRIDSRWRWESDERVVHTCRDAFGYPRMEQPNELSRAASIRVVLWCALGIALVGAWARWGQ